MRRSFVVASLALAVLAGAPAPATAQSAGIDSVVGAASDCVEFFEPAPGQVFCARRLSVEVDVESGPAGEDPTGTVLLGSLGLTPGGSVSIVAQATCLAVSGRVAIIGVAGSWHQGGQGLPSDLPLAGLLRVVDAGGPDSGADTFEFALRTGNPFDPPLPGPTTCSTFPGSFGRDAFFFPDFTNEAGDVVVADAGALPSTKDQCKNGGWQSFGVFKNQGDCVSFVATGGKDPPGNAGG